MHIWGIINYDMDSSHYIISLIDQWWHIEYGWNNMKLQYFLIVWMLRNIHHKLSHHLRAVVYLKTAQIFFKSHGIIKARVKMLNQVISKIGFCLYSRNRLWSKCTRWVWGFIRCSTCSTTRCSNSMTSRRTPPRRTSRCITGS